MFRVYLGALVNGRVVRDGESRVVKRSASTAAVITAAFAVAAGGCQSCRRDATAIPRDATTRGDPFPRRREPDSPRAPVPLAVRP